MDTKKATDHYLACFKKYADFTGRAERAEFWYFALFNFIISIALSFFDGIIGSGGSWGVGFLGGLFSLAVLLPGFAVGVRRLHDIGKSGLWIFIILVPIIGGIWLIVLFATEGDAGDNSYGSNPKGVTTAGATTA